VHAATARFALLGYADTPVSVLAEDAGLTPGTLYYYFPSKAALFAAVAEQARVQVRARVVDPVLSRVAGEPALGTRLRLLVDALVADAREDLTPHRLCFAADLETGAGTTEDEELLAVIETLTLGVWQFALRPKGLERLPILVQAVDAWLADTLFDT
jgi:AcrR family transcriptional regulator